MVYDYLNYRNLPHPGVVLPSVKTNARVKKVTFAAFKIILPIILFCFIGILKYCDIYHRLSRGKSGYLTQFYCREWGEGEMRSF